MLLKWKYSLTFSYYICIKCNANCNKIIIDNLELFARIILPAINVLIVPVRNDKTFLYLFCDIQLNWIVKLLMPLV